MNPNSFIKLHNSSLPSSSMRSSDVLHDLLQAIQNIVAGTVTVSYNVLSETRMECSIQISLNSPIIVLRYEGQSDHIDFNDQFPILECGESGENSGQNSDNVKNKLPIVCDNIMENHFTLPKHSESNDNLQENENKINSSITSSRKSEVIQTLNNNCKKIVNNYAINKQKEITTVTDIKYFCKYCGKSFGIKNDWQLYVAIHKEEKPFKHEDCDKSFAAHKQFIHYKKIHTRKKLFKCDHCYKSFISKSHLTVHLRIHTGEKPFKCEFCDKSFRRSHDLTTHTRLHTGEKPLRCFHCDKAFHDSSALTKHKRIHTGEKPFKCDHCDKAFSVSSSLTLHKRIHTGEKPFPCKFCDKAFRRSYHLTVHTRLHTGEKPFRCDHCNKAFHQSYNLIKHEKIHTGEKPVN